MEYNAFRDYCKAENSDDEEVNHDLQSRLYAEIYYASHDTINEDTKTNIKLETYSNDNKLHEDVSTNRSSDANDSFIYNGSNKNCKNACSINDSVDKVISIEKEDKPDIKYTCSVNDVDSLHTDVQSKQTVHVPCKKVTKHFENNVGTLKNDKLLPMCQSLESAKSSSNNQDIHNIEMNVKPEVDIGSKRNLETTQCLSQEIKYNSDNNSDKNQKLTNATNMTNKNNNNNNILKKYEFSKLFINKLYLQKFENLEKRLLQKEEEKKYITNEEDCEQETSLKSVNQMDSTIKYKVLGKTEKVQKSTNYFEEVTVLSSATESESEESILEVPIPPRPQPPIINLQDSDRSSDTLNSDVDEDDLALVNNKGRTWMINQDLASNESIIANANNIKISEDIILNCTKVQKGASNIKEIMEMSKSVQLAQDFDKETHYCTKKKNNAKNEVHNESPNNSDKSSSFEHNKDNPLEVHTPPKMVNVSNVVYERDKSETTNFAEDIMISNFLNSNEMTPNKKRYRENDIEPGTSIIQGTETGNDSKRPKTSPEQCITEENNQESWEEYFFRPMAENVKAFYNECRGQENFDIQKIQSKMSRDPKLWAILDEDLMPELLRRHRYWTMKCNNCHQQGHQRHNCPEPYKPIRCYMCGTQGHTETRCPQKMCLTCGKKQGTFRKTCESCRTLYCNMCKAVGHNSTECPDLWRRFHQTTRISEINIPDDLSEVMKPADLLYCCNCTRRGHDSSTCHEYRWSQHFPTPAFVSNYFDGPEYDVLTQKNPNEDVIPLTTLKKNKSMVISRETDDHNIRYVVYSYGTLRTKRSYAELKRKLAAEQVQASNIASLLNGRVVPTFLNRLTKLIKFEIEIYYDINKELMIRIRSLLDVCQCILEIFVFWLKLEDADKHLDFQVDFPHNANKLRKLMTSKLGELEKHLQDPNYLCREIERLKKLIICIQDSSELHSTSKKLLDFRSKLMKVFHAKPTTSPQVKKLRKFLNNFKKDVCANVNIPQFLNVIVLYNKIFLPRALTDVEIHRFLNKYYGNTNMEIKEKENNEAKKQKKLNPYETFVQNLQKFNESSEKAKYTLKSYKTRSTKNSPRNIEKQDKQVPTITSTTIENIPTSSSVQSDSQTVTRTAEISRETLASVVKHNETEITNVGSTECIQLPCSEDISSSNEATNTPNKTSVTVSLDSITVPHEKSTDNTVSSKQYKNEQLLNTSNIKAKFAKSNAETQLEPITPNSELVKTSNLDESNVIDLEPTVLKKKKSKKAKKAKLNVEHSLEVTEVQTRSTDKTMEDRANEIINQALEFNVPYMNKAVEEVKKKINDKNLRQEHIDTLQRLINLENDHRKYVSSFCNYLQ